MKFMYKLLMTLLFLIPAVTGRRMITAARQQGIIECAPRREAVIECAPPGPAVLAPDADGRYAPVFPGWGHYHYAIATSSDSAQFYFDQGLSLYYSYHLRESAASFREAARRDGRCAMAYWGQALAMGPYYNSTYTYKMSPDVLPVLEQMNSLAPGAGARERDLILAMNARYSSDTSDSRRPQLNRAYSDAMKGLIGKYPDDNDIKALYIDGVMCEHAWDMWDTAGRPMPWTPELVKYCENILARDPGHPAALHYHIHLLEASFHPEVTIASADKLKDLMPGVPHMVHMASHTYQRTGLYAKGVAVNDSASAAQIQFSQLAPQLRLGVSVIHYDAVETFCAMNGAMYKRSLESGNECREIAGARGGVVNNNLQFLSSMTLFALVRLGKWQEILDQPVPDDRWVYASLLSNFARGMAHLRLGHSHLAKACLDSLRVRLKDPTLRVRQLPFNTPVKPGSVAEAILDGELLFSQGRSDAALKAFHRGVAEEDGLAYLEPNEWPLPVRQYAGVCLLKMGRAAEAEKIYRDDLVQNPGNGWSFLGLGQSLAAQHKVQATDYYVRAKAAFAEAEVMPEASVY
jgi:tetratricopeptide (TPR) repeat protein